MGNEDLLDVNTFEVLFKEYFTPLCAYCQYKFDFDPDTSKEIVHNGFIKLWASRQTLLTGLPVKTYLYTIVTNLCLDTLRHEKVKRKFALFLKQEFSATLFDEGFNKYDMELLKADIDKALSELPQQMLRIFEMSRYEGLKYAEISQRLNISVKTVETQMSRALVKLREKLARYLTALFLFILLNL